MTSRERVLTALGHEEPDRVPLFIGTSGATTVLGPAYPALAARLGVAPGPERWFARQFQYRIMDEEALLRLGCDGRPVTMGPAGSTLRRDVSPDRLIDDWGCDWRRGASGCYFEVAEPPLRNASIDDLDRYPWPDLMAESRFEGVAERCRAVQRAGYACVLLAGITLFEQACLMRGLAELLTDALADQDFFLALMDRLLRLQVPYVRELTRRVGDCVDVIVTGDDLGTQDSTLLAPDLYRRLVKPRQAELLAGLRQGSKARIFYHSCGNIYPLLDDLADIGVDLLNPVQVSSPDMADTARLKKRFGKRLSFCGGIDTQRVLPHGTPQEVRAETRRRIMDLAPGGGYVAAAVHCIQPDVPVDNILAMRDAVLELGVYPLKS
jgi:uroporphyrinogen decarboxylase